MNKKTYSVTNHRTHCTIIVEIDADFSIPDGKGGNITVQDIMEDIVKFNVSEKILEHFNGDYTRSFLKLLCDRCQYLLIKYKYQLEKLRIAFESCQGWYPMNGEYGIKIISAEPPQICDFDNYYITEI